MTNHSKRIPETVPPIFLQLMKVAIIQTLLISYLENEALIGEDIFEMASRR